MPPRQKAQLWHLQHARRCRVWYADLPYRPIVVLRLIAAVAVNIDTFFMYGEMNNVDAERANQLPVPGLDFVRP